ncbi:MULTISPECIES: hypothetical protein [Stenotrophomonas]|jgi:hypothetical protein|uniref:hypothetical protein n=1 Tax=Stenotrophomonas TaxID=40323 RepID=UPI00066A8949|nr:MULTISPECIES: hypothetical protein [Stenotrophomonas]EKU9958075.1 hypothetical protein [Stenotrophomonas maltophilia]EKU9985971.1 hypothetical protein [Stenotrophomonas maltophilia]ELN2585843.1 hypothetical protein [Stenotrophomonas maltophilia]ELN2594120.1 hypothetical protein [Stenotrophomonas maltophilia]MBA0298975.1 hypothetical protein [Stenotrophomonas maltophilia]
MNKLVKALLLTLAYVVTLIVVYIVHMRWFKVDVVLYASIFDGFLAALIVGVAARGVGALSGFSVLEKVQLITIWLLGGYLFAISVPTVIDRSLSFYILEKIQQRGGGIREDGFARVFTDEYLPEHHLVEVRLTEQEQSGTIAIHDGCVRLTPRGQALATASRFYRQNFLPRQRLLMGQYTDALTDPFRSSKQVTDYECQ